MDVSFIVRWARTFLLIKILRCSDDSFNFPKYVVAFLLFPSRPNAVLLFLSLCRSALCPSKKWFIKARCPPEKITQKRKNKSSVYLSVYLFTSFILAFCSASFFSWSLFFYFHLLHFHLHVSLSLCFSLHSLSARLILFPSPASLLHFFIFLTSLSCAPFPLSSSFFILFLWLFLVCFVLLFCTLFVNARRSPGTPADRANQTAKTAGKQTKRQGGSAEGPLSFSRSEGCSFFQEKKWNMILCFATFMLRFSWLLFSFFVFAVFSFVSACVVVPFS